jgi:glycosyltransferase involved in cell wall biosynthesis
MRFSLVVPTLNRVDDVRILLQSLVEQTFADFEVLLVDQNDDDRLGPIVEIFTPRLNLTRLRSTVRNSSHARNVGLPLCRGELIAFPDDDCIYPADTLARVDQAFKDNPNLAMLTGPAMSPEGRLGSGRWERRSGAITMQTIWTSVIAFNLFISASWLHRVGKFDETLGVNAKFGSGEETDLVIRIIRAGGVGYYDFSLHVIHPDKALTEISLRRAFAYGTGLGYVLRKHNVHPKTTLNFLIRPVGGIVVSLLKGNVLALSYYWETLRGRVAGLLISTEK